ncbi:single-stranded DNA-binding protein [Deinococcus radiophilus]|uniref:Single-stranded DNA-binding protein n=1 Tax=Deinococcus radiophilus TaxID=32062 RepID=A0A3S0IQ64_9DEIO|nr:single-stranded DNA-binding protein [Deinococcus radiophilus]RTR28995.1 single-stranded DNA-binding protein [Deinococcus radiophilus]UFA49578.1 single-stranded DNA-binding protein [Deinococcus radiophilus]
MLHIEFITDLGAKVTVDVERPEQLLDVQRHYGRLGWTSGEVPNGGFVFPLDNEPDFDWSLIGARPWTNPEGEVMILHRGHAYRRRELEAVDSRKLKLPKAVKYSRGAKPTDPEHLREKADGEIEYVTLAMFRGGKRQDRFAASQGQGTSAGQGQPREPRAAAPAGRYEPRPQPDSVPMSRPTARAAASAPAEEDTPF